MSLIVQKFGGTSLADVDRICAVARRVIASKKEGHQIVVVVSAMAGETNHLMSLGKSITHDPPKKEQDLLLATGEQVTVALLTMALIRENCPAEGLLGYQVALITDAHHGRAKIQEVETKRLREVLARNAVPVIAGFQGMSPDGAITTIGRGGSDTSAVAVAAALRADRCEIYTDVAGVYTADPRIVHNAKLLPQLTYEEMLELAGAGAKVLHGRAVEIAARERVPLVVRSSFDNGKGTKIVSEEDIMEKALVSGITSRLDEAKVAIRGVPDEVGVTAKIFKPLADAGINIDMILQNASRDGSVDVTFTVPQEDLTKAITLARNISKDIHAEEVEASADIAKISVVGVGMRTHAGVAYKMFEALAREGIRIHMISTSEIRVAIVIDLKYAELATRALHEAFDLGK